MSNRSSLKKIIILAIVLAVPGFLYYLLQDKGKNRYRPLGIYGPKEVASTFHKKRGKLVADTTYHTIRDFKLTNQSGDAVSFPADTNRITVVNFFFSRCTSFCNQMNDQMARVVREYASNPIMRFYSISVDPAYDTPEVLKSYAARFNATPGKWDFLTGDRNFIHDLARKDFLVDAYEAKGDEGNMVHSPQLILIDGNKRIRGYYDSGSNAEVNKLIDEVKVLIAEELRDVRDR